MPTSAQWSNMWEELGVPVPGDRLLKELLARYSEPHRKYHTVQHLDECFEKLDDARSLATCPAEVELALWFHDAIYDVKRRDNEKRSAAWARSSALAAGVAAAACDRVHQLVMTTRHEAVPRGNDAEVLVDVDLSILGANSGRFDEYERQIREEYSWVPDLVFRPKRKAILKEFLVRPAIFNTRHFLERYEEQARSNLERSLDRLGR